MLFLPKVGYFLSYPWNAGDDVHVGDHDAFRNTCGSTGIHDNSNVWGQWLFTLRLSCKVKGENTHTCTLELVVIELLWFVWHKACTSRNLIWIADLSLNVQNFKLSAFVWKRISLNWNGIKNYFNLNYFALKIHFGSIGILTWTQLCHGQAAVIVSSSSVPNHWQTAQSSQRRSQL